MNLYKHIVGLSALTVITALPAAAQVEKVAIKTTGISCGTCAHPANAPTKTRTCKPNVFGLYRTP